MIERMKPKARLVTHSMFPGETITEAAKLCYSSKGFQETKNTDINLIEQLLEMGHESVFEHISFTFAIENVSRALTHQLVRHRIASYSQQSQRYVKLDQFEYIIPRPIYDIPKLRDRFIREMEADQEAYDFFVEHLMENYIETKSQESNRGIKEYPHLYVKIASEAEKFAIENARYVFPNACETKIMLTMNVRSLIHFLNKRLCNRAQDEIRELAIVIYNELKEIFPVVFDKVGPDCYIYKCREGEKSCGKPWKRD